MKILMVNKFLYSRGGAENYMLKLSDSLTCSGYEVQFFGMYDEKNTVGNSLNLYTQNMDFHSSGAERFLYPFKIIYSGEAYRKIGKVIDDFKPDIVHMNNINFQLTPSIIYAVKKRNIPLVQTVHDYQMICPNHLLYSFDEKSVCTRCIRGSRLNCLKHRCIHMSRVKSLIGAIEAQLYSLLKTYKMVDLYICPSRFLEEKLTEAANFYRGKTFMLHNFIEKTGVCEDYDKENPYIIFAGRLSGEKGISLLAQTARLMPEYNFVVAGNGPDGAELNGIPNVHMTGFLGGNELTKAVSRAKALILPSVWYENCPLTILEAHSMGVPVITMNSGGMAELVEDGVTGTLIQKADAEHIADAVRRTLDNEEKYMRLRENCRKKYIMPADDYCRAVTDKYRELIERRKTQ